MPEDLANFMYALAKSGTCDADFMALASARCAALCREATPKELCLLAWAFAKLRLGN